MPLSRDAALPFKVSPTRHVAWSRQHSDAQSDAGALGKDLIGFFFESRPGAETKTITTGALHDAGRPLRQLEVGGAPAVKSEDNAPVGWRVTGGWLTEAQFDRT